MLSPKSKVTACGNRLGSKICHSFRYVRLILSGKSHEHIAIGKVLAFLIEVGSNK